MKVNRIFAAVLNLTFLISIMNLNSIATISVFAAETEKTPQIYNEVLHYVNHGEHIEIVGCKRGLGIYQAGITIPAEIDGLPVTSIAEGAFADVILYELVWPEWITTVPANCFKDCSRLMTIVFPDTLKKIEANAFDGCKEIQNIFYKGDDAGWDAISIGTGNVPLQSACILTNFNKTNGRIVEFVDGEDNWSFTNGELSKYLLTDETLASYMQGCHPDSFTRFQEISSNLFKYYNGACGGFALASYMVSIGVLEPSDIFEGAKTLNEIPLCDEALEAITYYFIQSYHNYLLPSQMATLQDELYLESGAFLSDMEQGIPIYLAYYVKLGGHGVVAYGVEHGEWTYGDMTYDSRIIVSDNNFKGYTDEACIYYNDDFDNMYIPYWDSEASFIDFFYEPDLVPYGIGNHTSYHSTYACGDVNKDDTVNALDAAAILTAAAAVGSGKDSGLNNGQMYAADVNEDGAYDATDAARVLKYAAYAGTGGVLEFKEFLTESESQTV